jgi:hypothetical protein
MRKLILIFALSIITSSCGIFYDDVSPCQKKAYMYGCNQCEVTIPIIRPFANEQDMIALQNPTTKQVARCYSTPEEPAEYCAKYFESKNYVRFRDIPYKTANYDFRKKNTFPTRRWRDYERTPRW